MENKTLAEKLDEKYSTSWWVQNYVKTVTASTLVASGVGLVITGELGRMHSRGWSDAEIILGVTCVVLALIVTFALDLWAKKKDKEMITTIEEHIEERAEQIAEKKVLYYLNKIEKKQDD